MRASLYLIGFAAASIVGAGAAEIGCSSSSSPANNTPGEDAATDTGATTPPVDGGAPGDTSTACTSIAPGTTVETLAAPDTPGMSSWTCLEAVCKQTLTACSADCQCNNDILTALLCTADGGVTDTCFGPLLQSTNTNEIAVLGCLSPATTPPSASAPDAGACLPLPLGDAGGDGGGSKDAGPVDAGGG